MRKYRFLLLLLLVVATNLFTSCGEQETKEVKKKAPKLPLVVTQEATIQNMVNTISITGTIRANIFSEVVSPVDGVIENLNAYENEVVKKGNVIAVINPNERVSLIASNQLKVEQLQRQISNHKSNTEAYTQLQGQLHEAMKNLDYAKTMYQTNPVICPANGLITQRWLDEGAQVNKKDKILKITDMSSLVVKAEVNEQYFGSIHKGAEFMVRLNAYPDDTLTGVVQLVYPQIVSETRSVLFDVRIKNFNKKLLPGMMAVIDIPIKTVKNAVVVNVDAVLSSPDNSQFLFVLNKDGEAQRRNVTTGLSMGEYIEINGVSANEIVVVKGQEMLKDNMRVKVVNNAEDK